jgi:predicted regulator of Ras-like GTPase activity (Roadblock/LC7/MglB family)
MVGIFAEMASAPTATPTGPAKAALSFLTEMSPDLRGAAILDAEGAVLAASGEEEGWGEAARALLAAADAADGAEAAEQVHVATEAGEVFALRHEGLVAVAVSERFVLASLLFFDMRQALRDLAAGRAPSAGGGEEG